MKRKLANYTFSRIKRIKRIKRMLNPLCCRKQLKMNPRDINFT